MVLFLKSIKVKTRETIWFYYRFLYEEIMAVSDNNSTKGKDKKETIAEVRIGEQ